MPIFLVACSSREMLVKCQILFLLLASMTRNGVPPPADFRHFTEACEVDSHGSRRCASHSPQKSSNIRAIYQEASMRWIMFLRIYNYRRP